jgi:GxxExxY protein
MNSIQHIEEIGQQIVDSAIKVHRVLGPGLLESAYQSCLKYELTQRDIQVQCEVHQPIYYENHVLDIGYRIDMVVEDCVIVENKAVATLLPIHTAQMITYLKLSGCNLGYLINWNVKLLKNGLKRVVNNLPTSG